MNPIYEHDGPQRGWKLVLKFNECNSSVIGKIIVYFINQFIHIELHFKIFEPE